MGEMLRTATVQVRLFFIALTLLLLAIFGMEIWDLIVSKSSDNALSLNPDRDCYRILANPETANAWCSGGASSALTGTPRFWGEICFSDTLVDWNFQFAGGTALQIPTTLWVVFNSKGKEIQERTILDPSAPVHFVELDALTLAGNLDGFIQGTKSVLPEIGQTLRSSPRRIAIGATDATGVELCDFLAIIDPSSRLQRFTV